MINWEALPCSHRNCTENADGIYLFSLGSECFEDPLQPLCEKHFIEARSPGPIETIVSRRTEMEDRKELTELRAELSRERNRLYQLRAEALKFQNVREASEGQPQSASHCG